MDFRQTGQKLSLSASQVQPDLPSPMALICFHPSLGIEGDSALKRVNMSSDAVAHTRIN
jgi:hypothetical protein